MNVELLPIDDLNPDPNNANGHEQGLDMIAASLRSFGQVKPLVLWGENMVIAGNGTLEAAYAVGLTELYVVRTPDDWTYDKARAFALADNKTAELSQWIKPLLLETVTELELTGWDMSEFGFTEFNFGILDPVTIDGGKGLGTPIISYDIIFDDKEQQDVWFDFMKMIRVQFPDAGTNAERIVRAIEPLLKS
jgi:hypothetical protein